MDETEVTEDPSLEEQVVEGEDSEDGGIAGASLFDSLYAAAEGEPESEPEPEGKITGHSISETLDGAYDDPEPEPEPSEQEEASTDKKKVKRIHKKEVIDPDLPEPSPDLIEDTQVADDPEDFLLPEEKEQLKVVRHIAKKNNTTQDKELVEYFRKQKDYIEKRLTEDPDLNLSEDHDFEQFVARNRPQLDMTEVRSAEREMLLEEAEERAMKRLAPQVNKANIETRRLQMKPQVDSIKQDIEKKAMSMVPESLASDLNERSAEDVAKDNPYEFNIVNTAITNAAQFASEFIDISKGMVDFDGNNPTHQQLRDWLVNEQDTFIQSGQTKDKNGRPFIRRERYMRLSAQDRQKYWTWSDDQCVEIMYARAKSQMDEQLDQHNKAMQAYLNRNGSQQPRQKQVAQPVQQSPKPPKPTPRAGGTSASTGQEGPPSPLSLLGM